MKNQGTKQLETQRLTLRRFTTADASGMFYGWASDANVTRYLTWSPHKSPEETRALIQSRIEKYDDNLYYNWVVEEKNTHALIGNISVISVSQKNHNCEIGYCYGSKYWNQGYATEALKAVLDYLLYECEMHIVEAKYHSTNPASGRVMEKAGMVREAVLKERRYHPETNAYCDLIYYFITK